MELGITPVNLGQHVARDVEKLSIIARDPHMLLIIWDEPPVAVVTFALVEVATTVREQEVNAEAAHRWSAQREFPLKRGVSHTRRKFLKNLLVREIGFIVPQHIGRNRNCS